jgi:hypothetical protein
VDVIGIALRGVFGHDAWAMNSEVGGAPFRGRAAPAEIDVFHLGANVRHPRIGRGFVQDGDPGAGQVDQKSLLFFVEFGPFEPFGWDFLAVIARAEKQIGSSVLEDGLGTLFFIERIEQLEGSIDFGAEGRIALPSLVHKAGWAQVKVGVSTKSLPTMVTLIAWLAKQFTAAKQAAFAVEMLLILLLSKFFPVFWLRREHQYRRIY